MIFISKFLWLTAREAGEECKRATVVADIQPAVYSHLKSFTVAGVGDGHVQGRAEHG
jgi:hypothetical protein